MKSLAIKVRGSCNLMQAEYGAYIMDLLRATYTPYFLKSNKSRFYLFH